MLFGYERDYDRLDHVAGRPRRVRLEREQAEKGHKDNTWINNDWRHILHDAKIDPQDDDSVCGVISRAWSDEDSIFRRMASVVILAVYAFVGAGMFYGIEKAGSNDFGHSNDTRCADDFWSALFFANTLYTTIGFGTVAPCTDGGRIFAMIYTICGIPVMVLTVSNTGFLMAKWSGIAWRRLVRFFRSLSTPPPKKVAPEKVVVKPAVTDGPASDIPHVIPLAKIAHADEIEKKKQEQRGLLPFPLAILMCVAWILLSSLYFYLCERYTTRGQRWRYFEALYYFVVSVTTVGLGDYDAGRNERERTFGDFIFIIIGVSLFSMCVNIIQYDMEHLSVLIGQSIMEDYQKSLSEGHALGVMAAQAAAVSNDRTRSDKDRKAAEMAARAVIREMIHKKGGLMTRVFISAGFEDKLLNGYQKLSHMRLASTQTEVEVEDSATMTDMAGGMLHKYTSTRDLGNRIQRQLQDFPDLVTRERLAVTEHVKRLFTAKVRKREEDLIRFKKLTRSNPDISKI